MFQIGPGLILAGSIVGTGELIATTNLGAREGFVLLWLVILSCFIKVFVQVELGRHAISSGQTTLAAFRRIPVLGQVLGWWWLGMMLISHVQLAAVVGLVGQSLHMAAPSVTPWLADMLKGLHLAMGPYLLAHPELPWAVLAALATAFLLAWGGYATVEKGSALLAAVFTIVTVLCVVLLPAAGYPIRVSDLREGLSFSLPGGSGALAAAFGMFGITGVGATELVAYPYWCIEKGYARRAGPNDSSVGWLRRARGWLRVMLLDAWASMVVYTVATLAFFILGAAVLHRPGQGGLPDSFAGLLGAFTRMYEPVLGRTGASAFVIAGVFAVLYSTLYAANPGQARVVTDFLKIHCGVRFISAASRRRCVSALCFAFPVLDLLLYLRWRDPVRMVLLSGAIQTLTLPMIAGAAIYLRYRHTDRHLRPGPVWDVLLWISGTGMLAAAIYRLASF